MRKNNISNDKLLPKNWTIKKIEEFGSVHTGNTPATNDFENYGDDYLFVSPVDLGRNKYISKTEKRLSKKGFVISRKFPKGAILFTCIGSTIGKCGIASEALTSNQQINAIIVNENNYNEYLYYELERNAPNIRLLAGAQAVPIINKSQFENINLICPPLIEQKRIAQILSIWDKSIETTEKLIAAKELQKKGLMQKLLSGKKRFKGFEKEKWKVVEFSKVFKFLSTTSYSREQLCYNYTKTSVYNIHYGDIHTTYQQVILDLEKEKNIPVLYDHAELPGNPDYLKDGDLIIADASEDYEGVGKCIELVNVGSKKIIAGLHTLAVRDYTNSTCNEFRPYILKNFQVLNELKKLATGSKVYGVSKTNISKLNIYLPSIKEQKKIASILLASDSEIGVLKNKLEKLKEQKKGLMQILLTGKVRVKI